MRIRRQTTNYIRKSGNIEYILHVGDITNNNYKYEWEHARTAFDIIDGKIPYVLAAGNHDYDHTEGRLTYMNEYFKVADQKKWATFGDVYEKGKLENHYQFMEINGQKWIVLSLEMGPRTEVITWANEGALKTQTPLGDRSHSCVSVLWKRAVQPSSRRTAGLTL